MKRTAWFPARLGCSIAALALLAAGCGTQAEGEYCSQLNGNDDCDPGLVCTPISGGTSGARCCPPAGRPTSVAACVERPKSGSGTSTGTGASEGDAASGGDAADEQQPPADDGSSSSAADGAAD